MLLNSVETMLKYTVNATVPYGMIARKNKEFDYVVSKIIELGIYAIKILFFQKKPALMSNTLCEQ